MPAGSTSFRTTATMIAILAACVAAGGQDRPATTQPLAQPPLDPVVDKILTRLENRAVHDLRAELTWKLTYVIEEDDDASVKRGEIWYRQSDPIAKFLVHFRERIVGGRWRKLDEKHLFDGRWYVELQSRTRPGTITRREIRSADDPANPYKIGEGPFPLPFGQKKRDILREFEVVHIPPVPDDPPRTDHLELVPRPGTRTSDRYKTVDFWVSREGRHAGLPIRVRAAKKAGTGKVNSHVTITFSEIRLNTAFSGSVFEIKTPAGYEEYVETLDPIDVPGSPPDQPSP